MRLVSVKEALAYSKGEIIPRVRGRITKVANQTKGGEGEKAYTVQTISINDGTGEIPVKIWDRDAYPQSVKGQMVTISSKEGPKGMNGIKADDYRGEKSLKITGTGIIEIEGVDGSQASQPVQSTPAHTPAAQSAPAATQQTPPAAPASNGNGSVNLSGEAKEIARGYYRVMSAAHEMRLAWDKGHPDFKMTPEHFQAACASLFIHCDKRGMI
jgi:hypothetical protein